MITVGGTEGALDGFTLGLNVGDEVITEGDVVIVGLPVGEAESQGVPEPATQIPLDVDVLSSTQLAPNREVTW